MKYLEFRTMSSHVRTLQKPMFISIFSHFNFQAYGTYSKLLNVSLGVPCHTDYESGVVKRRDHSGIISVGYIMVI